MLFTVRFTIQSGRRVVVAVLVSSFVPACPDCDCGTNERDLKSAIHWQCVACSIFPPALSLLPCVLCLRNVSPSPCLSLRIPIDREDNFGETFHTCRATPVIHSG